MIMFYLTITLILNISTRKNRCISYSIYTYKTGRYLGYTPTNIPPDRAILNMSSDVI